MFKVIYFGCANFSGFHGVQFLPLIFIFPFPFMLLKCRRPLIKHCIHLILDCLPVTYLT